ncbi:RNA polymerase sigma factor (sigma-70 family) [Microbacterium testaceum]|nr:RNA polymerase sigma factor (sigma-70 family) [Microbacterium sp. SORGH_AS_0969]MDQ1115938.1 RNA polymerase sigma factor (sigma-70 family) [Microbacterium testaceum]
MSHETVGRTFPGMDEAGLWRRVAADGDERALSELYERHVDRVFRHAARLASDRRDAEDATAVAFFELWRRRDAVRVVDGSPLPWLLATTTNALRNLQRSSARYRRLLDTLPRSADASSAEDEVFADENARALLAPLGAVDRQLVMLVHLEGYRADEAAVVVGLSAAAARARLSRARAKLRDLVPDATREEDSA